MSKRTAVESSIFDRKNISLPRTAVMQGNALAKKQGRTFSNLLAVLISEAYHREQSAEQRPVQKLYTPTTVAHRS